MEMTVPSLQLFSERRSSNKNFNVRSHKETDALLNRIKSLEKLQSDIFSNAENYQLYANLRQYVSPQKYKNKANQFLHKDIYRQQIASQKIQEKYSGKQYPFKNTFQTNKNQNRKPCECQVEQQQQKIKHFIQPSENYQKYISFQQKKERILSSKDKNIERFKQTVTFKNQNQNNLLITFQKSNQVKKEHFTSEQKYAQKINESQTKIRYDSLFDQQGIEKKKKIEVITIKRPSKISDENISLNPSHLQNVDAIRKQQSKKKDLYLKVLQKKERQFNEIEVREQSFLTNKSESINIDNLMKAKQDYIATSQNILRRLDYILEDNRLH